MITLLGIIFFFTSFSFSFYFFKSSSFYLILFSRSRAFWAINALLSLSAFYFFNIFLLSINFWVNSLCFGTILDNISASRLSSEGQESLSASLWSPYSISSLFYYNSAITCFISESFSFSKSIYEISFLMYYLW